MKSDVVARPASDAAGTAEAATAGAVPASERGSWLNLPALIAVLFWSGMSPISKYALDDFPAYAYTAYRPLIATVVLVALLRLRGESLWVAREDRARLLVAGIGGMGLSQLGYVLGLAHTSVSHNVILLSTSPLIAAAFRWLWRRDAPDGRTLLGLAGGFAGVVVLVAAAGGAGGASVLGDVLSFGAATAWVIATILPSPLLPRYGAARVTAWLLAGSVVVTFPIGLIEMGETLREPPPLLAWLSLVYASVFGMLLGNALWQRAVQTAGASRTLVYLYLEPVGAIALAALFLGERLDPIQAVGGALALAGVALVRKG